MPAFIRTGKAPYRTIILKVTHTHTRKLQRYEKVKTPTLFETHTSWKPLAEENWAERLKHIYILSLKDFKQIIYQTHSIWISP